MLEHLESVRAKNKNDNKKERIMQTKFEKKMQKRIKEEETIKRVIHSGDNLKRLIHKIDIDKEYAMGFYRELCKKGFLDRELSNIFYSIIVYIEKLYFTACAR